MPRSLSPVRARAQARVLPRTDLFSTVDEELDVRHGGADFRLVEGDCLSVLATLPAQSIDLIFADPPYMLSNGGTTCHSGRRVSVDKGKWDTSLGVGDDHAWNMRWLSACQRVLKPTGTIWVSGTQHIIFSIGFAMQSLGYHMLNTITWFKPNASPNLACRMFTHSTEIIIWASPSKSRPLGHTFHYKDMKHENGGRQMRDLWEMPEPLGPQVVWSIPTPPGREREQGRHPTQKPLRLLERVIRAGSNEGDLVLDPFSGSGTTGLAALSSHRRFLGIDTSREYLDMAARRFPGKKDA